jgi:ComF family protein
MIKTLLHGLCDLVYPPICAVCHKRTSSTAPLTHCCPQFETLIKQNTQPSCPTCMRPVKRSLPKEYFCLCQQRMPDFDFAWSACQFNHQLRSLTHAYKYHQKTGLRKLFGQIMIDFVNHNHLDIHQFDLILPIPLHATRKRERGYNQSELLAIQIAQSFNINIINNILIKQRSTESHALLDKKERWTNIQGAFRIRRSKELKNKSILLIDDLLTTGATASEAAKILKENGAKTVGVFTLAIAT